jgi:hypothetical protein
VFVAERLASRRGGTPTGGKELAVEPFSLTALGAVALTEGIKFISG